MLLNVYKPAGPTSHDIVDKVRRLTGESKVGHGGTLDPFAEGVLVIGVSRESTKKLGEVTNNTEKEYIAKLELGRTSDTHDPEGDVRVYNDYDDDKITEELKDLKTNEIMAALRKFEGEVEQVPPKYSAVKVNGTPAYKLARQGKDFELEPRMVNIKDIDLIEWNPPKLTIRVVCGSGTYIRALARDIGEELGVGAYLTKLVRTRVGDYTAKDAKTLDELAELDILES